MSEHTEEDRLRKLFKKQLEEAEKKRQDDEERVKGLFHDALSVKDKPQQATQPAATPAQQAIQEKEMVAFLEKAGLHPEAIRRAKERGFRLQRHRPAPYVPPPSPPQPEPGFLNKFAKFLVGEGGIEIGKGLEKIGRRLVMPSVGLIREGRLTPTEQVLREMPARLQQPPSSLGGTIGRTATALLTGGASEKPFTEEELSNPLLQAVAAIPPGTPIAPLAGALLGPMVRGGLGMAGAAVSPKIAPASRIIRPPARPLVQQGRGLPRPTRLPRTTRVPTAPAATRGADVPTTPVTPTTAREAGLTPYEAARGGAATPAAKIMGDLSDFNETVGLMTRPDIWRRIANAPVIRSIMGRFNPSAVANDSVRQSLVGRAVLRDQGNQLSAVATARWGAIGTQGQVFGKLTAEGLIADGPLKGVTVNTVRSNPGQFAGKLTPEMDEWVRVADDIERAKLDFLKKNGIEINELTFEEGGQYAGRRVWGRAN